jgi:hypothetical protein
MSSYLEGRIDARRRTGSHLYVSAGKPVEPLQLYLQLITAGRQAGTESAPAESVTLVQASLVLDEVTVTVAPGTGPPFESTTHPLMDPVPWAPAGRTFATSATARRRHERSRWRVIGLLVSCPL